ncbi:hypothetical protein ScPMuIL_006094 [Solemya velum]
MNLGIQKEPSRIPDVFISHSSFTTPGGRRRSNSTSSYTNAWVKDITSGRSPSPLKQLIGHRGSSSSASDNGPSFPKSQKVTTTKKNLDDMDKRRMERLTNLDNRRIQPALLQQVIDQNRMHPKPDLTHLGMGNAPASNMSHTLPEPRPDYEEPNHLPGCMPFYRD